MSSKNNGTYAIAIIVFIMAVVTVTVLSSRYDHLVKEYDELYDQYLELELKCEGASSWYYEGTSIGTYLDKTLDNLFSVEDDVATVWCFFNNEEGVTFEEAHDAFDRIHTVIHAIRENDF